jgi:hypothetical protein
MRPQPVDFTNRRFWNAVEIETIVENAEAQASKVAT